MIISVQSRVIAGPWGGGNLFTKNIIAYLNNEKLTVINNLYVENIDVILMTDPLKNSLSTNYSYVEIKNYKKYINPNVKVIHRINECDERKNTNFVNDEIMKCNEIADSTVFVSNWLKNLYENIGLLNNNSVIVSGSDRKIFNNSNKKQWDGKSNVKVVTHHWGTNLNKGFEIYKLLDDLIYTGKISNIDFTFIGNLPKGFNLRASKHIHPLQGELLAQELKEHDVYLTASINEPSGNHHIEGAQCGLPLIYLQSGGVTEYCENYGVSFKNREDFESSLKKLINNYQDYINKIMTYPNSSDEMCSEYLKVFEKSLETQNKIEYQRNLFSGIYKLLYKSNKIKSRLI
tara:strand:+ start:1367 stop:2404 length:1038 start_codon:yes stop_codon:yes gene_type:complete